ncbi:hypothetical protein K0M31_009935 [Melipona bicolor]|uniref:Uncharacterized protein n=1 Tax=Melipona bicolor TaxID=60889 RepID=A0AA40FN03_9HYME|nr:hypothetical protein K0M31_009935 [Melipona bicolor]
MVPTPGSDCSRPREDPVRNRSMGSSSFFGLFREFFPSISRSEFPSEITNEIVPLRRCSTSLEAMEDSQQLHKIVLKGGQGSPTPLSAATRSAWPTSFLVISKNLLGPCCGSCFLPGELSNSLITESGADVIRLERPWE